MSTDRPPNKDPKPSSRARQLLKPTVWGGGLALGALAGTVSIWAWHGTFGQAPAEVVALDELPDRFVEIRINETENDAPPIRWQGSNKVESKPQANPDAGDGSRAKAPMRMAQGRVGHKLGSRGSGLGGIGGAVGRGSGASGYGSGGGNFGVQGMGGTVSMGGAAPGTFGLPPAAQNNDSHKDHGVNDFFMVSDDALSTFSVDVDTASYTLARRWINQGSRPPTAAVRVEEFINYQKYGYEKPIEEPFAVHMEAMPDPFRDGHHILRVGVQGRDVIPVERKPIHLTFLVDTSCSMASQDKLNLAQSSLHLLTEGLQESDTVALATYAGRVARIMGPTPVVDKAPIHRAIDSLRSNGGTAMSSGIDLAYEMASDSFVPGHENRVIIMSDGDANVGRVTLDELLSQIKGYADKGVTVSTIGFGQGNYKDNLMEQLANNGDGNSYYIDTFEQSKRVFGTELLGTLFTIARDVKIQVEFNPNSVSAYRLIGYENRDIADEDFRDDRIDAGEVGAGHSVTALYDVLLADGYERQLATVRLRYEQPGPNNTATEHAWAFSSSDLTETPQLASSATRLAYTTATFAEVLRGSPHAEEISLSDLIAFGKSASTKGNADHEELIGLMARTAGFGLPIEPVLAGADVGYEETVLLGALSRPLFDAVVKRHMNQIRYCYQRELTKQPGLAGSVVIKMTIDRTGAVSNAVVQDSTMPNANVGACVAQRFRRFQFPEIQDGGIAIASVPFHFQG